MIVYKNNNGSFYVVPCPYCGNSVHVSKNGKQYNGIQRYKCMDCFRSYQDRYIRTGVDLRQGVSNRVRIHTLYTTVGVPLH